MADRRKKRETKNEKFTDKYAKKLLNFLDNTTEEVDQIDLMNSTFRSVVNNHLKNLKSSSSGAIIDFIQLNEGDSKKSSVAPDNFMETLTENATSIYSVLSEKTRSVYAKYLDIEYVIKFNPALKQALDMTVNHICCADEATDTIVYNIVYGSSFSKEEQESIKNIIEKAEDEYDIRRKLKNNLIAPAVKIGTAFCYIKPYSEIFKEYDDIQKKEKSLGRSNSQRANVNNSGISLESFGSFVNNIEYPVSKAYEGITLLNNATGEPVNPKEVSKALEKDETLPNFVLNSSPIPYDVLSDAMSFKSFSGAYEASGKATISTGTGSQKNTQDYSSGVMDSTPGTKKEDKNPFDKYTGVYIKIMEFRNMVPVTLFGEKVCYLYIHSDKKKFKQEHSSRNGMNLLNGVSNYSMNNKEKLFDNMVAGLCNQISKDFGMEFLDKNIQFKRQIAECLITHGFTNNKYKIQVIPASDIIEFKIKEDANGDGHSLLEDSIVPGKMLASLTVSKLLNYLNKYGDRTLVNYTKNPMDASGNNMLQALIRNFQESDINLPDILSGELIFNKIGRNNRIAIPKDENGTRVIEFEQLEGQRVDLNTDYEEYLNKLTMMGSSVPSAIMEYTDQLDFAKQVTTSNIKYAVTVSGLQGDLEPAITQVYRRILKHSSLSPELISLIDGPEFKVVLARPRVLSNTNLLEAFGSAQQMGEQLGNIILAAQGIDDNHPNVNEIKSEFQLRYIAQQVPFIDIKEYEEMAKTIIMEAEKQPKDSDSTT